jgi:hypothetical protein
MLTGHVVDSSGAPVAGAMIRIESSALIGGPREIETDAEGAYRATELNPGRYRLEARAPMFRTAVRDGILLEADERLVVDASLEVAALAESVRVSEAAPVVDVTSAAAPYRLTDRLLANLPTSRVASQLMNLLPGVNVDIGLGGVQQSNPLLIDGVNTADANALMPRASYNYNWLEDVQVVAVGAGARYGEFNGIIQKARLRSGGNRFSGLGELRTTRPGWVDRNTGSLAPSVQSMFTAQSQRVLDWWDTSVQLGGPLLRDRLWFFVGLQRSRNNVRPALYGGDASTDARDRRALVKLDAAPSSVLRLTGHYEDDRNDVSGDGLGPSTPIEATWTNALPNRNWNARLSRTWGARTTLEIADSGSRGVLSYSPTPPATRDGPAPHIDQLTGASSGNVSFFFDGGNARHVVSAAATHAGDGWLGGHEFSAGAEYEWSRSSSVEGYPGGRLFNDLGGVPFRVNVQDVDRQTSRVRRASAYLEDRWSIAPRLTLEPGVRVSFNRGLVSQGTVLSTNPVSPRLGIAWDLGAGHTTVLRAHYGRYHDALLTSHVNFADSAPSSPLIVLQASGSDQFVELSRTTASAYAIDAATRPAYFDQWVAGVERQVGRSLSATAQYIWRVYRDQVGFVDRGSIYQPVVRPDPGPDGRLGTADDGGSIPAFLKTNPGGEQFVFTNPPGVGRRYDALQLIGRRQSGNDWQLQASYTWSSMRGNAVNGLRSNSGGPDLGINGVTADPNRAIKADGPMPFDFTHEAKVLATWRVPRIGVTASGVYQAHTGSAWGRATQLSGLQFVTFGVRVEPRGTRRTPALNTLDLRLEKTFSIPRTGSAGVFADDFNVGNQGIPDPSARRPVFEISGPLFGQPQFWLPPRTLRVGVRLAF